ncbi:hypothetical protein BUALT_BualtUnG0016700 [Buddleja alternifolia]|uniref:FHA domain-containing protein n=1 Tax=Buddleja alternifolia TaxID=168488 RepID=A0AAV6W7K0_9LAMI|nr:hypothetical protein BUALT_BualtUnG0016700 [Buddleja alternifolia]
MEIVSSDGSKFQIKPGQTQELGRSNGLDSSDRTISRRHVSFFVPPITIDEQINLQFEVIGRNPIYVSRNDDVKIYRRFERGEMRNGDMFCVSSNNPVWYALREVENGVRRNDLESELADNLKGGLRFKDVEDLQQEEFGFVVIGHEFDSYPKKMIRDIKNWDWFLEESRKDSDDDNDDDDKGKKEKGSGKGKGRKVKRMTTTRSGQGRVKMTKC